VRDNAYTVEEAKVSKHIGWMVATAMAAALIAVGVAARESAPHPPEHEPSPLSPVAKRVYRIGYLTLSAKTGEGFDFPDITQRLAELGYVEGEDYVFVERHANQVGSRLRELADELVAEDVDVIVAATRPAVVQAKNATTSIPIIMTGSSLDPVGDGLVESLARPGGNLTGMAAAPHDIELKRIQMLVEAIPGVRRIMVLGWGSDVLSSPEWAHAAQELRVEFIPADLQSAQEVRSAFELGLESNPDAVIIAQRANLSEPTTLALIADLAQQHRLPAIAPWRGFAETGGLFSYEATRSAAYRRVAEYVDAVLRGADPATTPVEVPSVYDFILNADTARALNIVLSRRTANQITASVP
jgi:putative tryptophan/tyrosine transport system substrate-binding protein